MASTKAPVKSIRAAPLTAWLMRAANDMLRSPLGRRSEDAPGGDEDDRGERGGQEHLPAQPHELVVAVAGHDGLGHGDHEEGDDDLDQEPQQRPKVRGQGGPAFEEAFSERPMPAAEEQD